MERINPDTNVKEEMSCLDLTRNPIHTDALVGALIIKDCDADESPCVRGN